MRVAIVGMGAVGGYFGGRLAEAGADVMFLVRPGSYASPTVELGIESPFGNWRGSVRIAPVSDRQLQPDVLVLATKAYDLSAALDAVADRVSGGARLVPLLNGIRHLDEVARRLPGAAQAGGTAHIMASRQGPRIIHSNKLHRFRFGPLAGGTDDVLVELGRLAGRANMDAAYSANILDGMWAKFQMLAALSAACCLTRGAVGDIVATDNGVSFMDRVIGETAQVAAAEGHPCSEAHLAETRMLLTEPGSPFSASMLRDMEAGRPTEGDHILGDLVRRGRRHGLELPVLECAWTALQVYETQRGDVSPP